MKASEWDDNLLEERRRYIDGKEARAAFDYLVTAAVNLRDFECRPALQGAVKTFGYWDFVSKSRDFAFIVAKNHLTFYIRPSGLARVRGGFEGLKKEFVDAESKAGEWVVHFETVRDASRLHSFPFNVALADFDERSVAADNAVENGMHSISSRGRRPSGRAVGQAMLCRHECHLRAGAHHVSARQSGTSGKATSDCALLCATRCMLERSAKATARQRRIQSLMAVSGRLEPSFYLRPSSIRPR
jgi:hypothetical protein